MFCDIEMDDPAPIVNQDDQYKQDLQSGGRHDEEVDRGQFVGMPLEKNSPAGGGRFTVPGFVPVGRKSPRSCDSSSSRCGGARRLRAAETGEFEPTK